MTNILLLANKKFVTNRNELMYDQALSKWLNAGVPGSDVPELSISFVGFLPLRIRTHNLIEQMPIKFGLPAEE